MKPAALLGLFVAGLNMPTIANAMGLRFCSGNFGKGQCIKVQDARLEGKQCFTFADEQLENQVRWAEASGTAWCAFFPQKNCQGSTWSRPLKAPDSHNMNDLCTGFDLESNNNSVRCCTQQQVLDSVLGNDPDPTCKNLAQGIPATPNGGSGRCKGP